MRTPVRLTLVVMSCFLLDACSHGDSSDDDAADSAPRAAAPAPGPTAPKAPTTSAARGASTSAKPATPALAVSKDVLARGAAAFSKGTCAKCHGSNGKGTQRGPDLTDSKWLHCDGSVAGIRGVLASGVPREKLKDTSRRFGMNPATNLVAESELDALAAYVKQFSQHK